MTMEFKGKKLEGDYKRAFRMGRLRPDAEARSVELSFSSEEPYERVFGTEVLGHKKDEIDLTRLEDGAHPLLLNHDPNQQIGVVEKAWLDGQDRKGRAVVRFSKSRLAQEIWEDVTGGIRKLISVGYTVNRFQPIEQKSGGDEESTIHRAVSWTPFEVSVVPIPADTQVGIGKNKERKDMETKEKETRSTDPPKKEDSIKRAEVSAEDARRKRDEEFAEMAAYADQAKDPEILKIAMKKKLSMAQFKDLVIERLSDAKKIIHREEGQERRTEEFKSVGQLYVDSELYKKLGPQTGMRRTVTQVLPRTGFDQPIFSRATFSATTESLTSIQKLPGVPGILDQQPLRIAALFAQGTTNSVTVRYIQEDTYTQAATAVAEGGTKPEATLDVSEVDATVRKIAVVGKVTDEMFADFAQMQSYVDGRLSYMVESLEDNHLLNGTGASNQITGILNVSGIQTEAAAGHANIADAFQHAITKVRSVGFIEPTAIVLHPNDWRDLRLTKDANGQYYGGGPFTGAYGNGGFSNVTMLWGLPAVSTTAITEGTALVGAFRTAAQLFRRQGLTIESTNSNEDDFINNIVAIRAEKRLTLACYKPLGFCTVTGIA